MKSLYTYIPLIFLLLLASCTDQEIINNRSDLPNGTYRFTVTIPEAIEATTRTLGETPQDVMRMPMRVLVFDENGFFVAYEVATVESFDDDSQKGTYTVNLPVRDDITTLHFVLGLDDADYGGTFTPSDSEASIFSQLAVSDGQDAYWQRISVQEISEGTQLPTVHLVRNFAKISVETSAETPERFELLGYAVVNERTAGTVAPYTGNHDVAGGFATFELNQATGTNVYEQFTSLNPGFGGNNAGERDDALPQSNTDFTSSATYVYERNQDDSSRPAYILIHAKYDGVECYYKLDLVTTDRETWLTTYLNLYRNFHYKVIIGNVTNQGYSSIDEAAAAVASNNIGASIEVSEVNTIRDGQDELYVSTIDTLLVTLNQTAKIYYRFTEDVENNPDNVQNDQVNVVEIDVDPDIIDVDKSEQGVLKITPKSLPETMETYEFAITVNNSGLSRRVIVRVREPYRFEAVDCEDLVPDNVGEAVNLMVRLPANMPVSVFPLTLRIEPYRKTIYPDAEENQIPVATDPEEKYTFFYEATVTHGEYTQNRIFNYVFKTNIADSKTFITVTNPYFVDESRDEDGDFLYADVDPDDDVTNLAYNVTKFRNAPRYNFFNVSLTSDEGNWSPQDNADSYTNKGTLTFTDGDYNPIGNQVTLTFSIHDQEDVDNGFDQNATHPEIEIFARYLDFTDGTIKTTTGTWTRRDDGQAILYTPNDPLAEQSLTFTINTNYASETVQLASYDHETARVNYKNTPCTISVEYGNRRFDELSSKPVSVYDTDPGRFTEPIFDFTTNSNGEWDGSDEAESVNTLIIGRDPTDILYFRYTERGIFNSTNYEASMTIEDLLRGKRIQLKEQ